MVEWSKVNDLRNGKWGENLKFEIGDGAKHPSISAILGVIKSTKVNNLS